MNALGSLRWTACNGSLPTGQQFNHCVAWKVTAEKSLPRVASVFDGKKHLTKFFQCSKTLVSMKRKWYSWYYNFEQISLPFTFSNKPNNAKSI